MPYRGPLRRELNAPQNTPLAGIIDVVLLHQNKSHVYSALIDTGSPISTISAKALQFFRPTKWGRKQVRGATELGADYCDIYRIDEVHFAEATYRNHPLFAVSSRDEEMIIGRDILQFHMTLFDGPNEELEVT